jgi:hypothetical protein
MPRPVCVVIGRTRLWLVAFLLLACLAFLLSACRAFLLSACAIAPTQKASHVAGPVYGVAASTDLLAISVAL